MTPVPTTTLPPRTEPAPARTHLPPAVDPWAYPAAAPAAPYAADPTLIGGLAAQVGGARRITGEPGWSRTLRRFGRSAVWAIPAAAICFAVLGVWGWPDADRDGRPVTGHVARDRAGGLWLTLLGAIGLAALLATTAVRRWSLASVVLLFSGTILLGPVLGLAAVARPQVARLRAANQIAPDAAANLDGGLVDGSLGRWLAVGGLALLAFGWFALGCGVIGSGVLSRADGFLVLLAVAVGVAAAYLSWEFLLVIASMIVLAAGLGIAWTASRVTPEGAAPDGLRRDELSARQPDEIIAGCTPRARHRSRRPTPRRLPGADRCGAAHPVRGAARPLHRRG